MTRPLSVHLLPDLFEPDDLRGGIAVMIDLLRASTTIVHALAAGARGVIPCREVDEARAFAANHRRDAIVLGGERQGRLIEGFDLDNSPLRYTADTVGGRTLVFTTTNGTRALWRSRLADRILVGAFVNLSALVEVLAAGDRPVHLVCAGTRGRMTAEDCLCAGAIAAALSRAHGGGECEDDQARIAMDFYATRVRTTETFRRAMFDSLGGRELRALGFEADVERSAETDRFHLVPEFFPDTGRIEVCRPRVPEDGEERV